MDEYNKHIIFDVVNNWREKSFLMGANINTSKEYGKREYYLCLYLGFWNLYIGFRL